MLTKPLGATSLRLPAIGQGAGDYFWNADIGDDQKVGILRLGVELGLNFIDTAEEYGQGSSEKIVARATAGLRDQVIISSKFSPQHHTYEGVTRAVEGSLQRLGTDYIDIYQVHWSNPSVPLAETMGALGELVANGKVRCVGMCNFSQAELIEAQEALGSVRIATLQTEYNLFERTVEYSGLLDYCAENDISVIAYSPLDQGRIIALTGDQRQVLESIGQKHGKTVAQVILRWLVSNPSVVAIARTTRENHLRENRAALDFELTPEDLAQINATFPINIIEVPTDRIRVATEGEWGHTAYQTLEEAIENKHGATPSPMELAGGIKKGEFLKPVRVVPSTDPRYDYDLIAGRIRYWAWVIAHQGKSPIPVCVREDLG